MNRGERVGFDDNNKVQFDFWRGCRSEFVLALVISAALQAGLLAYAHVQPEDDQPRTSRYLDDRYRQIRLRFEETFYPRGRLSFQMPYGAGDPPAFRPYSPPPHVMDDDHTEPGKTGYEAAASDWDIEVRDFSVAGRLSRVMAHRIIEGHSDGAAGCFAQLDASLSDHDDSYEVGINLTFDASGRVASFAIERFGERQEPLPEAFRTCLVPVLNRWEVLTYSTGEPVSAAFRFIATRRGRATEGKR